MVQLYLLSLNPSTSWWIRIYGFFSNGRMLVICSNKHFCYLQESKDVNINIDFIVLFCELGNVQSQLVWITRFINCY
jgi:hypothetical protein